MQPGSSKVLRVSSESFDAFNDGLQSSALQATKASTSLPSDVPFHRSVNDDFGKLIDSTSEKALSLTNRLLYLVSTAAKTSGSRGKGKQRLEDQTDVLDRFESLVVDTLDHLLENADVCLDDFLGRNKTRPMIPSSAPIPSTSQLPLKSKPRLEASLIHAAHISKPQTRFKTPVDNFDAWSPSLKHKYNAQIPLGLNLIDESENIDVDMESPRAPHPYEYEIKHISYPRRMFEHCDPIPAKSFDEVPLTWVDSTDAFHEMLDKLRSSEEIAVDLEYHNYRTFAGFVCLMQVSSREEDFIVDTLILRDELQELNEVFTDPKIVKVFHGAESDIIWLQQNFNVYVVNLFDTYHASKELDFPRHGLAALLEMYCDFIPDKRYQLADWRIRPLPDAMMSYARSDTHFLLFIYDNLRNVLLDRSGGNEDSIRNVLSRSEETSLRIYESEVYDADTGTGTGGWETLLQKWNKSMSGAQLTVYRAVHQWRDQLARKEDESTRYVLPNHFLFQLAERPPADMAALMASFRSVPPLVRTNAASLLDAIKVAHQRGVSDAIIIDSPPLEAADGNVNPSKSESHVVRIEPDKSLANSTNVMWSFTKESTVTSTFLGGETVKMGAKNDTTQAQSSLFPSGWRASANGASKTTIRYQDAVSRIHAAMGVTPAMPALEMAGSSTDKAVNEASNSVAGDEASELPGQIEIPFVPPSQRKQALVETSDTIVVVGQAGKKRKRTKQTGGESDSNKRAKDEPEDDFEPFDYDSVPNLLDGPTDRKDNKQERKPKEKKAPNQMYGKFPAPPRAYSEVKAGNQSHTFR